MERQLFISYGDHRLFGVLHEPENNGGIISERAREGIIFCHPFAEEKLVSHRIMVNYGRFLASHGYYVLRFDYMGHGDSSGDFESATIETRLIDIGRAVAFLRENINPSQIGLLGVRLGATLCALYAEKDTSVDFLILINPILDGRKYIEQCLRSNLTMQMFAYRRIVKTRDQLINDIMNDEMVNIDGYLLNKALYLQMKEIDLAKCVHFYLGRVLIMQIVREANGNTHHLIQDLGNRYRSIGSSISIENVQAEPFWAEKKVYRSKEQYMFDRTLQWLKGQAEAE